MRTILYHLRCLWAGVMLLPGYIAGHIVYMTRDGYNVGMRIAERKMNALLDEAEQRGVK